MYQSPSLLVWSTAERDTGNLEHEAIQFLYTCMNVYLMKTVMSTGECVDVVVDWRWGDTWDNWRWHCDFTTSSSSQTWRSRECRCIWQHCLWCGDRPCTSASVGGTCQMRLWFRHLRGETLRMMQFVLPTAACHVSVISSEVDGLI